MSAPDGIDRVAPTLRPAGRPLMTQTWSELMFLHWRVPAAALRPLVPAALEIDTFAGAAWVGLVPFTITRSRVPPLPALPFFRAFPEINVRTYVHRRGGDPGVWFFSLDAAQLLPVLGARLLYALPYRFAFFAMDVTAEPGGGRVRYTSRRPGRAAAGVEMRYGPTHPVRAAAVGTLEHFLAERYILYATRGRALLEGRVHHAPYPLQEGAATVARESLLAASGITRPPEAPLLHYAARVDVEIWPPTRIA